MEDELWFSHDEPLLVALYRCDECGEPIYRGDEYYQMPDGSNVCEHCLDDWTPRFLKLADWGNDD